MDYTIWTDGGCIDNPNGKGGYGVVMLDNQTNMTKELSEGFLSTTNNRMEVRAIIRALSELPDGASAMIYSDSKYAINVITGVWSRGKNTDLWPIVDAELSKKGHIEFCWVKGHADNENNNRCDELATYAQTKHESEMIPDEGFIPLPKVEKPKKNKTTKGNNNVNAMLTIIEPMIPDAEITDACADAIRKFNAKDKHTFGDYQKLKVGGKDFWSYQPLTALEFYFGAYIVSYTKSYFDDEKSLLSALRWHGRGIAIEHAIRKVMVDNEIANNM